MATNDQQPMQIRDDPEQGNEGPTENFHELHSMFRTSVEFMDRLLVQISARVPTTSSAAHAFSQSDEILQKDGEILDLKTELVSAGKKIEDGSSKIRELEAQLHTLQDANKKLKASEGKLRKVILGSKEVYQTLDSDMVQLFGLLYQALQVVAHSRIFNYNAPTDSSVIPTESESANFSRAWTCKNKTARRFMVQEQLSYWIHVHVLSVDTFGLGQMLMTNSRCPLNYYESKLQDLEAFLRNEAVSDEALTDWRLATMACTQQVQAPPGVETSLSNFICATLKPALKTGCADGQVQSLRKDVARMCRVAYELRLLMRRSKDDYWCDVYSRGTRVELDDVDIHAVEHGSEPSALVAYTLFGALSKHAKHRGEEPVVLEKARVVVQGIIT
ncbi:hypothetical protein C2857_006026 [Epichloe festucae Fl1]|uniref:Uncharacterized protein n=1 Tax=Epichloe festucae (strain Fl1) TaxID=877507 RepID=A0A7S9KPV1_EPIFF|nr:hypothetical protein C2857_006026 [Epichloe festucae Fl1]